MHHELLVFDDADTLAHAAADYVVERAQRVAAREEPFTLAVSGGKTPVPMFDHLARDPFNWAHARLFQVDERVAPAQATYEI